MAHLLTPNEAADLLQMDVRTLLKWSRDGYVPSHPLGSGRRRLWRYFEAELLAFVESENGSGRSARDGKK